MKYFLKKSLVIFTMLISFLGASSLAISAPTYAANNSYMIADGGGGGGDSSSSETNTNTETATGCRSFLGMPAWDCGIKENPQNENDLKDNFVKIASNIATAIGAIAMYLVIGYVIYGGYLYIFSSGDTGKLAAGKKTITHAFIGLAIVGLVDIVLNSIHIALVGTPGDFSESCATAGGCGVSDNELALNAIHWFIGIAGVVSAIYVVIGGVGYVTSSGDSAKLQKAKTTIFYALLGLGLVAVAEVAVIFISDLIDKADVTGGDIRNSIPIILNGVIGFISVIAVIFIVLGGARYITSAGDPGKMKKAKDTILYACIGLAVCALAFAIVNFAVAIINNSATSNTSTDTSLLENSIAFLEEKL